MNCDHWSSLTSDHNTLPSHLFWTMDMPGRWDLRMEGLYAIQYGLVTCLGPATILFINYTQNYLAKDH